MEYRDEASARRARHTPITGYGAAPLVLALILLLLSAGVSTARADFGIKQADVRFTDAFGLPASLAGSHPATWTTSLALNSAAPGEPEGSIRTLRVQLPPGLLGVLAALPGCSHAAFDAGACPPASAIGTLTAILHAGETEATLYALSPSPGAAGELGLSAAGYTAFVRLTIATAAPHDVIATFANIPVAFSAATLTIDTAVSGGSFLIMPRACSGPLSVRFEASSAQRPGLWATATATTHDNAIVPNPVGIYECARLGYSPVIDASPSSRQPASPSGLQINLYAPDPSLLSPTGFARADTARAELALPEGMTVNPPLAAGLATCTPADLARETPESAPAAGCPEAAKLGSAEVTTPLFAKPIAGSLYAAEPDDPNTATPGAENPFDSLLALYLVFKDPERGILLSLPIRLDADPDTGRLTASFSEIPQLPLSKLTLDLREGPRAPLSTPASCAPQQLSYKLTPSSGNPPLERSASFPADPSCAAPGFSPTLSAGTTNPAAGRSSPFVLDISSPSDAQNLSGFSLSLPPGLSADFGVVPLCPEADVLAGNCPTADKLGYVRIALGAGPEPLWVPAGEEPDSAVYLAGPYRGAPYSLVIVIPARAGPFDLGTVTTRASLGIDPTTAQAHIVLDPLPQILDGIPLDYRDLRLVLDRPDFIRNPTSCESARILGTATSVDGVSSPLASRFQAADCAALPFRPRLALGLSGALARNGHPTLKAVLTTKPGQADIARAALALPQTELLEYAGIRAVCSPARYASGGGGGERCPPASRYGHVKVFTPLLDRPLEGPVYLRSNGGQRRLPDLVASLGGQAHLDLVAHLSPVHGLVRAVFVGVPDLPLSRLVLQLRGGRRGLLVNTRGLCRARPRARAAFLAHNDKRSAAATAVKIKCGQPQAAHRRRSR